jgi:hypothetical protein
MARTVEARIADYEKAWISPSGSLDGVYAFLADNVDFSDYGTSLPPLNPTASPR